MVDARSDPVVVVSNDTHIGPRLVDDLRQYCPSAHLEDFDRFAAETAAQFQATVGTFNGGGFLHHPNLRTLGLPRQHEHGTDPVHLGRRRRPKSW